MNYIGMINLQIILNYKPSSIPESKRLMIPYVIHIATPLEDGEQIAKKIIQERLGACCQIHKADSRYIWKQNMRHQKEVILSVKTFDYLIKDLERCVEEIHSYEHYEMIGYQLDYVSEKYLEWMKQSCKDYI
ncbi:hypothetical protein EDEG_00588 [Edhazardia aedis USNM 41457]|uniref:Divalent-cation tolerance protein CutA n=1 Tax=Edhazardia aedis (strain USNM 41457) TaxID=1003232 RepID=J9DVP9_EDHAE|nr:hypothetical protein EDEG_00588 [Edhazardia aedis USNM 41457]|eukprot:EJW05362.1 hypothetical protein EDEG_00588 [Edhazardia aedis USNM 41457]